MRDHRRYGISGATQDARRGHLQAVEQLEECGQAQQAAASRVNQFRISCGKQSKMRAEQLMKTAASPIAWPTRTAPAIEILSGTMYMVAARVRVML